MELGEGSQKSWLIAEQERDSREKTAWMYVKKGDGTQRGQVKNEEERLAPSGIDEESYDHPCFPGTSSWKKWGQGRQHYYARLPALTF